MAAYYNEHDKFCAGWLRNLIAAGHIAAGDVDDRDIRDVAPADLRGYTQVHLFAGIGLWSHALRMAGWGDDRPIWTASCPCQPFSAAGSGGGIFDDRHLWPAALWLIAEHNPVALLGEQVASPDGLEWFDIVASDLGACGYAVGAVDLPAAGVGAPNIRQRLWWAAERLGVADRDGCRAGRFAAATVGHRGAALADGGAERLADAAGGEQQRLRQPRPGDGRQELPPGGHGAALGLGHAQGGGRGEHGLLGEAGRGGQGAGQPPQPDEAAGLGLGGAEGIGPPAGTREPDVRHLPYQPQRPDDAGRLGHASDAGLSDAEPPDLFGARRRSEGRAAQQSGGPYDPWRDLEWIHCRDGVWRPTQPGLFPLAPRRPGDVAKLRAYGNAINPVAASVVIRAWMQRHEDNDG